MFQHSPVQGFSYLVSTDLSSRVPNFSWRVYPEKMSKTTRIVETLQRKHKTSSLKLDNFYHFSSLSLFLFPFSLSLSFVFFSVENLILEFQVQYWVAFVIHYNLYFYSLPKKMTFPNSRGRIFWKFSTPTKHFSDFQIVVCKSNNFPLEFCLDIWKF